MSVNGIPDDRRYTESHQWIKIEDDFTGICGITGHGLEMLSDPVYVQPPELNLEVTRGEHIGLLESVYDILNLYAPVTGIITAVNSEIEEAPDIINSDPYENGWIFSIDVRFISEYEELMDSEKYRDFIS